MAGTASRNCSREMSAEREESANRPTNRGISVAAKGVETEILSFRAGESYSLSVEIEGEKSHLPLSQKQFQV